MDGAVRIGFAALAVLLAGTIPAAAQRPTFPHPLRGPLLGVSLHDVEHTSVPAIADAGFSVVRTELVWWRVVRPDASRDWSMYDRWVDSLRKHQLIPLLILGYEKHGLPEPRGLFHEIQGFFVPVEGPVAGRQAHLA